MRNELNQNPENSLNFEYQGLVGDVNASLTYLEPLVNQSTQEAA